MRNDKRRDSLLALTSRLNLTRHGGADAIQKRTSQKQLFFFFPLLSEFAQCLLLERSSIIHSFSVALAGEKGMGGGGGLVSFTLQKTLYLTDVP